MDNIVCQVCRDGSSNSPSICSFSIMLSKSLGLFLSFQNWVDGLQIRKHILWFFLLCVAIKENIARQVFSNVSSKMPLIRSLSIISKKYFGFIPHSQKLRGGAAMELKRVCDPFFIWGRLNGENCPSRSKKWTSKTPFLSSFWTIEIKS